MRKMAYGFTAALTVAVVVVELLGAPVLVIFALTSLALVGLAWVLGQATESLGHHAGPRIGGVLNATFGNAAELIITIFALAAGLTTVINASMLAIVAAALALPTIFAATVPGPSPTTLSIEVAAVMFVLYVLYLLFYFRSD